MQAKVFSGEMSATYFQMAHKAHIHTDMANMTVLIVKCRYSVFHCTVSQLLGILSFS